MTNLPPRTSSLPDSAARTHGNLAATAPKFGGDISRPASTGPKSADAGKAGSDFLSDKATAAFIRRTLCVHQQLDGTTRAIEDLLPPLTSSNEVDLQLYAIIAVVLKEFVYTWYAKITPDHVFVDEVLLIIAHCTRALEQRLRKVDLEALLLDEIPTLIDNHITAYRTAHLPLVPAALAADPRQIYHALNPHPALSPTPREGEPETLLEQARNEEVWRQLLVDAMLAVLLPTEDLENRCLRALVSEILSEMIIGKVVSGKLCEPWTLWDIITTALRAARPGTQQDRSPAAAGVPTNASKTSATRLEQFGLLNAADNERQDQNPGRDDPTESRKRGRPASQIITAHFWSTVSFAFMALTAVRAVIIAMVTAHALPSRSKTYPVASSATKPMQAADQGSSNLDDDNARPPRAVLSMRVWRLAGRLVELDERMPWLSGFLALVHCVLVGGLGVGGSDGLLDRTLSHHVTTALSNPTLLPTLLQQTRKAIFPNNALGPARPIPSPAEQETMRKDCAAAIVAALPEQVARRYLAGGLAGKEGEWRALAEREAERLIDVLGDGYMNRHLVFGIVEAVVVRVLPELAEQGVEALLRERLVGDEDGEDGEDGV